MNSSGSATVVCYSGHTYAQEPRAFSQGTEHHTITEIRRQWREPTGPRFEVLADDGVTYLLAYDETTNHWQVSRQRHHPQTGNSGSATALKTEEDGQG